MDQSKICLYSSAMISVSTDNSEIYGFLEKSEQLFPDFSMDKVLLFEYEDDYCLIIFLASSRNFILFKAQNYLQESGALPDLLNTLLGFSDGNISSDSLDQAIKLIENKIHSKNNSRFYFDAH